MKYFYAEIIEIESITVKLDELELTDDQKLQLAISIDSIIHHTVLDIAFSHLALEDKRAFAEKVKTDPTDKTLMDFLRDKIDNIEEEIVQAVEQLKQELHKDIIEAKKMKT